MKHFCKRSIVSMSVPIMGNAIALDKKIIKTKMNWEHID